MKFINNPSILNVLNFNNYFLCLVLFLFISFNSVDVICQESNSNNSSAKNNCSLFLGDTFNSSAIYGISDSWFDRYFIFRQSPYNSLSVTYKNVSLNSIIDGSFRSDLFLHHNIDISFNTDETDILVNTDKLSANTKLNSSLNDSSLINLKLQGGNIFGSTVLGLKGKSDFITWSANVDYLTSSGFDISKSKSESIGFARPNSGNEKLTAGFNVGIDDKKSKINLEFIYSQGKQEFPFSLNKNEQIYIREPDSKFNLVNLQFKTILDNDLKLFGNIFYTRNKNIVEKFDSSNFKTTNLESSFIKSFEESKYGWNSALEFTAGVLPPGLISLNYSRESVSYQQNSGKVLKHFSYERLSLGTRFFDTSSALGYSFTAGYKLLNPLTVYSNLILDNFSDFEYSFLLKLAVGDDLNLSGSLSRSIMLPMAYLIYPELNQLNISTGNLETTINNSLQFGVNFNYSDNFRLNLNYFNSYYENIQIPFSLVEYSIENIQSKFNSSGLEFTAGIDIYIVDIIFNANYYFNRISIFDNFGRELLIPNLNVNVELKKKFDFGMDLAFKIKYISDRESLNDKTFLPEDFFLLNFYINQKILGENSLFLKINNLMDKYYEIYKDMPMPGIFFVAGINLIL
jgi:outer membrane cobalamin receptor